MDGVVGFSRVVDVQVCCWLLLPLRLLVAVAVAVAVDVSDGKKKKKNNPTHDG